MTRRRLLALILFVSLGATTLASASAGAAAPAERGSLGATRVDYPGYGIEIRRTSGDQRKLVGTSRSFKRFVKARLEVLFEEAGSKPRCAASPTVVVDRYHSAGFASAGEGWYGTCPAGGYAVIYEKGDDGWHQILGTQEARFCQDLAWWGVPRFVGGPKCLTEDFKQTGYRPADTETVSPEATARRVVSLPNGAPIVPAENVILPAAQAQQDALIDDGAYLTVEECVSAADGGPLAVHLGTSPYGCEVTATYKNDRTASFMMRMNDDFVVTELFEL